MEPKKLEPFLSKGSLWSTYLSMKLSRHEFYFEEMVNITNKTKTDDLFI